jgi:hypothetical protein
LLLGLELNSAAAETAVRFRLVSREIVESRLKPDSG